MTRDTPPKPEYRHDGFYNDHHTRILADIYGTRMFRVADDGALTGLTYKQEWVTGVNTAKCYSPRRLKLRPGQGSVYMQAAYPGPESRKHNMIDCGCGFYAFFDSACRYGNGNLRLVAGVIKATGRCIIGTKGFRASNAEIVALSMPHPDALKGQQIDRVQTMIDRYHTTPVYETPEAMLHEHPLSDHLIRYELRWEGKEDDHYY